MRFLSLNHLRLGRAPAGIPTDVASDRLAFSSRAVWQRAVALAMREHVHAVLLTGETISHANSGLEPWGPLIDGIVDLERAGIPIITTEHGEFTAENLERFTPTDAVHWLNETLNWNPVFTTTTDPLDNGAVHIVAGALAESLDSPVKNPITLDQIDRPDSIWILTDSVHPDLVAGEYALVVEPGSASALTARETGRHGAWLIDTELRHAELFPLAGLEYAAIDIDISDAETLEHLEQIIGSTLVDLVDAARSDGSVAETMVVDATLVGASKLYPALSTTAEELQTMLRIEHSNMTIALSRTSIDATPQIDLEPLLIRPDPVGEVARLIQALDTGDALSEAQARLLNATEQKLLAISHARVFGSILDMETDMDAFTLLRRQGWATLDALVRQRGID